MSAEKERMEMAECSFTPKILAKTGRNKLSKINTVDAVSLGKKMHDYANKFKKNLETKKKSIDIERGQQINFTPKITKTKLLKINREKGEVYEDLYEDYSIREAKLKEKKKFLQVKS